MCNGNGRGGERLYHTNEGDGIRTVSARQEGKERTSAGFTVKPSRVRLTLKAITEVTFHEILYRYFFHRYIL